jgi:hypothetical protein
MGRTLVLALVLVSLVRGSVAAAPEEPEPWRPVFFASLALTVGTGVIWGLSVVSVQSEADQIEAMNANGTTITQDDCNNRGGISGDVDGHFDSACTWRSVSRTAGVFAVGFGVVTIVSAIFAFRGGETATAASGVSITPTLSRNSAGAQLQLRW